MPGLSQLGLSQPGLDEPGLSLPGFIEPRLSGGLAPNLGPGQIRRERAPKLKLILRVSFWQHF